MLWKNVLVIIGMIFTIPLFCTGVFPLIGIPMWVIGYRRAEAKLRALETGAPAEAVVFGVTSDTSVTINGRHPWRITYIIETPSGPIEGWTHAWELRGMPQEGDHVWAVYVREDPTQNALWPPIK